MITLLKQIGRRIYSSGLFSFGRISLRNSIAPDHNLGLAGEKAAARYLKQLGYRILEHSHLQRLGEIDLIALDQGCIVFVEVKTWRSDGIADPSEAVSRSKQEKLTRAALIYLKKKKLLEHPSRFDVVSVVWPRNASSPHMRHFKNAFEAVGQGQMYR